jgi:hypothetical protein
MKVWQRILLAVIVALAVILVAVNWVAPVALSYYAARKAPAVTRIVPVELKDKSISNAPGMKLSYFGYEFEVPWNDLDNTQSKLYPKDSTAKTMADLHFRSGLRLMVTAIPPREWAGGLAREFKSSPQKLDSMFGRETMQSDYNFLKTLYEFTPDQMDHWARSQSRLSRDEFLLMIKSIAPLKSAESGIFNIENQDFKGFQQGNPGVHQDGIAVHLCSNEGSIEIIFFQKDYHTPGGLTQSEINRIVASMRRASPDKTAASMN